MRYTLNLIKEIRLREKKARALRGRVSVLATLCFFLLAISLAYSGWLIFDMHRQLNEERTRLAEVEAEYQRYQEAEMIVDREDIELLNRLQHNRIFWTRKLASMAYHLPENYWITKFGYDRERFDVNGYGYITKKQQQLITIDDYLNLLRKDDQFADVFGQTYLKSTVRRDEGRRERVSFDYAAEKGN
jgi:hypothetical protein